VNYDFDLGGGMNVDGAVGLRAVETRETLIGTQLQPSGPTAVNFRNSYTDWLPNANMRIRFTPEWQLRLAATKTRTRPPFVDPVTSDPVLNPSLRLDPPPGCTTTTVASCARTGTGGNPYLKPLTSWNYDVSLEYYFSRVGFASLAAFRRDMHGFIVRRQYLFPTPDATTGLPLLITGPVNTGKDRIQGFEAQLSTFFDFGGVPNWLKQFGVQANATYIDAKGQLPTTGTIPGTGTGPSNPAQPFTSWLRLPDVSKWTYNLVGMYEGHGLTVRLAYNLRTGYPEGALSDRGGYTLQGRAHPISRLDWSSSYAINPNITLFFDWTNILGRPFRSDIVRVNYNNTGGVTSTEAFPMVVRYEESVLTGGVRFRF
jgi:TonB-dependent receptor